MDGQHSIYYLLIACFLFSLNVINSHFLSDQSRLFLYMSYGFEIQAAQRNILPNIFPDLCPLNPVISITSAFVQGMATFYREKLPYKYQE